MIFELYKIFLLRLIDEKKEYISIDISDFDFDGTALEYFANNKIIFPSGFINSIRCKICKGFNSLLREKESFFYHCDCSHYETLPNSLSRTYHISKTSISEHLLNILELEKYLIFEEKYIVLGRKKILNSFHFFVIITSYENLNIDEITKKCEHSNKLALIAVNKKDFLAVEKFSLNNRVKLLLLESLLTVKDNGLFLDTNYLDLAFQYPIKNPENAQEKKYNIDLAKKRLSEMIANGEIISGEKVKAKSLLRNEGYEFSDLDFQNKIWNKVSKPEHFTKRGVRKKKK
jgi:hypothetical protein